jgi:hypothetical protein
LSGSTKPLRRDWGAFWQASGEAAKIRAAFSRETFGFPGFSFRLREYGKAKRAASLASFSGL